MERSLRRGSVLGKAATQRGPTMQLTDGVGYTSE